MPWISRPVGVAFGGDDRATRPVRHGGDPVGERRSFPGGDEQHDHPRPHRPGRDSAGEDHCSGAVIRPHTAGQDRTHAKVKGEDTDRDSGAGGKGDQGNRKSESDDLSLAPARYTNTRGATGCIAFESLQRVFHLRILGATLVALEWFWRFPGAAGDRRRPSGDRTCLVRRDGPAGNLDPCRWRPGQSPPLPHPSATMRA